MGDIAVTAAKVAPVYPTKAKIYTKIAGETITAGQVVYMLAASGKVALADEDEDAAHSGVVGIALNGGAAGAAIDVLYRGHVYGFTLTGIDYGVACSLSNTAGALLDDGTATGTVARVVALPDNSMTKVLYVDVRPGLTAAYS